MGNTKLGTLLFTGIVLAAACSKSAAHTDTSGATSSASSSSGTTGGSTASSSSGGGGSGGSSASGSSSMSTGGGDAGPDDGGDAGTSTDGGDGGTGPTVGAGACASLPMQGKIVTVAGFDQAAITTAIAAASSGDTVLFPAGTYAITSALSLKGGVLYHGEPGAILHATGGTIASASGAAVAGISLDGLTFDGGNIILSGDTTNFSAGVNVVNCTIQNVTDATNFGVMQGILVDHLTGSRFDCNTFTKNGVVNQESYALIVYTTNQTSFSHNLLTSTYQGFHFESADTTGGNGLTVSYNQVDALLAIGIEFNKNASNAVVEHNVLGNWRAGNANGMALSIVPTGSNNSVRYNTASGAGCSTCNIGLEANGTNSVFEDNTIDGFYTNIAISCATGSTFSGNVMNDAGMWGPFDKDGGYCGGQIIGTNTINGVVTTGYSL